MSGFKKIYRFDVFLILYVWIKFFTSLSRVSGKEISNFNFTPALVFLTLGMLLFLLLFLIDFINYEQKLNIKNRITPLLFAIILSLIYSFYVNSRMVFIGGLSASVQVLLISLFIPAIALSCTSNFRISNFLSHLNFFAIINTLLVYITFLSPNFLSSLGIGEVSQGVDGTRAFGVIGDQVGWMLTFFSSHALLNKRFVYFGFYTVGIFMTATVGAIIIWAIVLGYFLWGFVKKSSVNNLVLVGIPILVFSLGLLSSSRLTFIQRITSGSIVNGAIGHRLMSFSLGYSNFLEKPIFGAGFGTYSYLNREKFGDLIDKGYETGISHTVFSNVSNQLLQIAVDLGLVGICAFVFFMSGVLTQTRRNQNQIKKNLGIWCVVFMLFNQSAIWLTPGSYLWVFIAASIGLLYSEHTDYDRIKKLEKISLHT